MDLLFFLNSAALGVGLAMDAFSVSLANGLNDPKMSKGRTMLIAGTFAFFQFAMPMIGWVCIHTIVSYFKSFQTLIPWIALILLLFIGGHMLKEGFENNEEVVEAKKLSIGLLMLQGIATSIDALSVGFTIAEYSLPSAFLCALIIAVVTMIICVAGVSLGKKFGMKFAGKAAILGGIILILIGLEIFVTGIF